MQPEGSTAAGKKLFPEIPPEIGGPPVTSGKARNSRSRFEGTRTDHQRGRPVQQKPCNHLNLSPFLSCSAQACCLKRPPCPGSPPVSFAPTSVTPAKQRLQMLSDGRPSGKDRGLWPWSEPGRIGCGGHSRVPSAPAVGDGIDQCPVMETSRQNSRKCKKIG